MANAYPNDKRPALWVTIDNHNTTDYQSWVGMVEHKLPKLKFGQLGMVLKIRAHHNLIVT